jgi:hypothetical protein
LLTDAISCGAIKNLFGGVPLFVIPCLSSINSIMNKRFIFCGELEDSNNVFNF